MGEGKGGEKGMSLLCKTQKLNLLLFGEVHVRL